jgi:hypothetical protein
VDVSEVHMAILPTSITPSGSPPVPPPKPVLNGREFAEWAVALGLGDVPPSRHTLRAWRAAGLPHMAITPHRIRYEAEMAWAWLLQQFATRDASQEGAARTSRAGKAKGKAIHA